MTNAKQNRDREGAGKKIPLSYFITLPCYGTWLHGDERGYVDKKHNVYGTPFKSGNVTIKQLSRTSMKQDPYQMDRSRRRVIKKTIIEVCDHRQWLLVALHVRSEHLHTVIHAKTPPGRVRNDIKSYGSRRLNENNYDHEHRKRWTRGGSGIFLWETDQVQSAIRYTFHEQGTPMQRFMHPDLHPRSFREYDHRNDLRLRKFFQSHGILDAQGNIIQNENE